MTLEFDDEDLKPEFCNLSTSKIEFEHLNEEAQAALRIVGRGTFYRHRGTSQENYNVVHAK
jgi:hypothetical protein